MRLLTFLLLFLSALAHAGNSDFIKATINGKPYAITGDSVAVYHEPGGTASVRNQSFMVTVSYEHKAKQKIMFGFNLAAGEPLKPGTYIHPSFLGTSEAELPYAYLQMEEGAPLWTMEEPTDGAIIITAVNGKVVEGTFHGKLRSGDHKTVREVTNGTFRFTME